MMAHQGTPLCPLPTPPRPVGGYRHDHDSHCNTNGVRYGPRVSAHRSRCHLMWGEALKVKVVQDMLEAEWGTVVQFVLRYLLPLSSLS